VTSLRPIVDFQLGPPPTWAAIPVAPQEGEWPLAVADRLTDNDAAHKRLAIGLMPAHRDLIGPGPHAMAAIWVPDPGTGDPQGVLTVDLVLADPGRPLSTEYYRHLISRTQRPGTTVLDQSVEDITLPAGPAVRERERIARSAGRLFSRRQTVYECVMFTVFPTGASDALQLTFSTDALDFGDAMAADADATATTLNVLLGETDATS
jgi:hypothetical protein